MKTRLFVSFFLCVLLAGCASGPTLRQSQASIPSLSTERARVFFYRPSSAWSAAVQPEIRLDGRVIGSSVPGGVFYCDVKPGKHIAAVTTEGTRTVNFDVAAGESTYVKMDWAMGFMTGRINFEVIDPTNGAEEADVQSLVNSECPSA